VGAMLAHMPKDLGADDELLPGGDIRATGNMWLRVAYKEAKLLKVPREGQIRLAVKKIMKEKKIGA